MKKTMVELFAGVGGFRYALEKYGWKTVWANQWEPSTKRQHAFEVYTARFGIENASNTDINEVDKKKIPEHTLLVGGFPCQDYSVARTKAQGIQGKKGVLWWNIYEVIKQKRPPFVLLENVDRLIKSPSSQRGRDFAIMLRSFHDLGYSVEWRVINAADYGFPQRRRRVFIFATKASTEYYKRISQKSHSDIILKNGFFPNEFKVEKEPRKDKKPLEGIDISKNKYKDLVKVSDNFNARFHNAGVMTEGKVTSYEVLPVTEKPTKLSEVLQTDVDERYYVEDEIRLEKFKRMKGAKKEKRVDKNGYEYYYSEGGMSFPDDIDKPARTVLTSETTINRSTHIIKDPVTNRLRLLTPVEVERLNGFPDDWTKPGNGIEITNKKRYFFMGNALVTGLVKRMAKNIDQLVIMKS